MDAEFINSRFFVAVVAGVLGVALTIITQLLLGRRGLLTYSVSHSRVGMSADDAVFGTVRVVWNQNPVANLFLSTVELRNESLKDYENVSVRVFTTDTRLLTERTEVVGTTRILRWTDGFARTLAVQPGDVPSQAQWDLYRSQRDYLVPTLNRGQVLRFTFLNDALEGRQPTLWVDVLHKGTRVKFGAVPGEFWGVPLSTATLLGSAVGLLFLASVIWLVDRVWLAASLTMLYGILVVVPGALVLKAWRKIRGVVGG